MNDLISRQAAIDALDKIISMNYKDWARAQNAIRQLPSAQPEITDEQAIEHLQSTGWMKNHDREMYDMGLKKQLADDSGSYDSLLPSAEPRWIPVTERLPEIDMSYPHHEDYLVQYDSGNMDVASWSNVNRFWTDHVTEPHWNCVQFAEVIAWMPLPKPPKEERR